MKTITRRLCMLSAALTVALLSMVASAPEARADCCGFGIYNYTDCPYRICVALPGRDTCYAVPTGNTSYTLPECGSFTFYMVDICNRPVRFPAVIGECVRINMGTCCLLVCRLSECRFEITYGHCEPCY